MLYAFIPANDMWKNRYCSCRGRVWIGTIWLWIWRCSQSSMRGLHSRPASTASSQTGSLLNLSKKYLTMVWTRSWAYEGYHLLAMLRTSLEYKTSGTHLFSFPTGQQCITTSNGRNHEHGRGSGISQATRRVHDGVPYCLVAKNHTCDLHQS